MKSELKRMIEKSVCELQKEFQIDAIPQIFLEVPKKANQGDYSTPVAMAIGAMMRQSPRKIAEKLLNQLAVHPVIEKIEIAGAGYLNFTLKNSYWQELLKEILEKNRSYGRSEKGKGVRVQIEFVSANPTGLSMSVMDGERWLGTHWPNSLK
jgi:arginyl-tRNA synthetase